MAPLLARILKNERRSIDCNLANESPPADLISILQLHDPTAIVIQPDHQAGEEQAIAKLSEWSFPELAPLPQ